MTLLCAEADDICCQQTRKQQQQFNCEIYVVLFLQILKLCAGSSAVSKNAVHGELKEDCAIVQNSLYPFFTSRLLSEIKRNHSIYIISKGKRYTKLLYHVSFLSNHSSRQRSEG